MGIEILEELDSVITFALDHKGQGWAITSIDAYRYKDSGEYLWSVNMVSQNRTGDRAARLNITKENGEFHARPVDSRRWPGPWPRRRSKKDGQMAYALPDGVHIEPNTYYKEKD